MQRMICPIQTNEFIHSASPMVSYATTRGHLGDCDIFTSIICISDGNSQQWWQVQFFQWMWLSWGLCRLSNTNSQLSFYLLARTELFVEYRDEWGRIWLQGRIQLTGVRWNPSYWVWNYEHTSQLCRQPSNSSIPRLQKLVFGLDRSIGWLWYCYILARGDGRKWQWK